jgi:hypothetical protein
MSSVMGRRACAGLSMEETEKEQIRENARVEREYSALIEELTRKATHARTVAQDVCNKAESTDEECKLARDAADLAEANLEAALKH